LVEIGGLVCAKSRRAGEFSCFLIGITGGSLFYLEQNFLLLSVAGVNAALVLPESNRDTALVRKEEALGLDLVSYDLEKPGLRLPDGRTGLITGRAGIRPGILLVPVLPVMSGEGVGQKLKAGPLTASKGKFLAALFERRRAPLKRHEVRCGHHPIKSHPVDPPMRRRRRAKLECRADSLATVRGEASGSKAGRTER
jgi:hypothetical protein